MNVELVPAESGWSLVTDGQEIGHLYVVERPADIYIHLRHRDVVLNAMAPPRADWRSVTGALLSQFDMTLCP